jgi:phosphopantothenoylcysteine decarboxylase/phosphopantothenate--cysteine ligase
MAPHKTLVNRRVLVGITGGIAAYKVPDLVRRLKDEGADVRVVMTPGAQEFITPLTLQAVSGHPVGTTLLDEEAEAGMGHIELAKWADMILVAPATADFMARLVGGLANDLLTTVCLASDAKLAIAPAMNQQMWANSATQDNLQQLKLRGVSIFGPGVGSQACGDIGAGRMLEVLELVELAANSFESGELAGKTVVITAGPTREPIDPVRYISNHSSGKMGYAIAQSALDAGAKVILITGPTQLQPPDRAHCVNIETAEQLLDAALQYSAQADVFIATAAVADYRVAHQHAHKMKKTDNNLTLELVQNPDVLATVSASETRPKFVVGFAAETNDVLKYARAKLDKKGLDAIVANDVSQPGIGFNSDDNEAYWLDDTSQVHLGCRSKHALARHLVSLIAEKTKNNK